MLNALNRNVHPLYAVMAFVAAIISLILYLHSVRKENEGERSHLPFFAFIFLFCLQDGVWGLLASGTINSDAALMVSSAFFHAFSSAAPFVWTLYYCRALRGMIRYPDALVLFSGVLLLSELAMIIANFFTHFMFYVDVTGNYQSTPMRKILFYLQFTVYVLMMVLSLIKLLRTRTASARKTLLSFLWISIAPVFFGVFQMLYPDAPANSAGLCIAGVLVQSFLTQTVEIRVHELKAEAELHVIQQKELLSAGVISTLSLEYGPLYLADLKADSLQVFRRSDVERALPVQQLATETPEYTAFIREYARRYVVENDREAFLAWTEPEHLESIINTKNISEFNYQRDMNGTLNFYQFCSALVPSNEEQNLMVFGFRNVDVVVKKELETKRTLEKALADARVASEAKTRFLFNMSHDIRTPMNAILGYTDLTAKNLDNPERATVYLHKLDTAGHHLLSLINEVLDMSRIESGKLVLHKAPMNLTAASTATMEICTEAGRQHGVTVELHRGEAGALWIYGDEVRINQIALNIISNAVKYTNPGGRVDIWVNILGTDNDTVSLELVVKDTGIGMSEEFLKKIFDPFERSTSSTVSGIQGTGLGMSIVKQLVEMMNGTIHIASTPNVGTTVTVGFRFRLAQPDEAEAAARPRIAFNPEGLSVLLVEDNEMNREIACEMLEEHGVKVDTAEDGDIAVEKMLNAVPGQYDLILMDVQMPRMNGYDATRTIRALSDPWAAGIPIVAMTANAFEEDRKNALDSGMNGHLAKPIDVAKLFETIANIME